MLAKRGGGLFSPPKVPQDEAPCPWGGRRGRGESVGVGAELETLPQSPEEAPR